MTKRKPSVPATPPKIEVWAFPCGCVATGRRANRTEQCDGRQCYYTPAPPAGTRRYRA